MTVGELYNLLADALDKELGDATIHFVEWDGNYRSEAILSTPITTITAHQVLFSDTKQHDELWLS